MTVTKTIQNLYLDVLVTALLFVAIAGLMLWSGPQLSSAAGHDKLYHAIAFAALTLPICSFRPSGSLIIISLATLFGAMIEIIQPLVGRQGDIMDFGADALGICLGWCVAQIYRRLYCRANT
jgi:VanZ family protein